VKLSERSQTEFKALPMQEVADAQRSKAIIVATWKPTQTFHLIRWQSNI
jgi:hypothetical protein